MFYPIDLIIVGIGVAITLLLMVVLPIDKVGFASMDRFQGAPKYMHPSTIMPNAKTVIVFLKRTTRYFINFNII